MPWGLIKKWRRSAVLPPLKRVSARLSVRRDRINFVGAMSWQSPAKPFLWRMSRYSWDRVDFARCTDRLHYLCGWHWENERQRCLGNCPLCAVSLQWFVCLGCSTNTDLSLWQKTRLDSLSPSPQWVGTFWALDNFPMWWEWWNSAVPCVSSLLWSALATWLYNEDKCKFLYVVSLPNDAHNQYK